MLKDLFYRGWIPYRFNPGGLGALQTLNPGGRLLRDLLVEAGSHIDSILEASGPSKP